MKELPIGIQDFEKIIRNDYLYIDKTEQYHRAFNGGSYFFLSRPRRFGKSLMLSTLKALYLGKKELFKGLWIEDKWDWEAVYPVIHIDLNKINTITTKLTDGLNDQMADIAEEYGLTLERKDYIGRLAELMTRLSTPERKCVILVDEYDKPITDYIHEPNIATEHIGYLKGFYAQIKSAGSYIHKAIITGVSKHGKTAILSDLNNLSDVSTIEETAKLCGYTQEELEYYFEEHIEKGAQRLEKTRSELMTDIRFWYNGYAFDTQMTEKVYNPFFILKFFDKFEFTSLLLAQNFGIETEMPTFLAKIIVKDQIAPAQLEYSLNTEIMFKPADLKHIDALYLLFQIGYLTIKEIKGDMMDRYYVLGYPNHEVRQSFVTYLLAEYMQETPTLVSSDLIIGIKIAIQERDWATFFKVINRVFATVPYQIFESSEAYYHSLVHVILTLSGHLVLSELSTNKGRIDTVLKTKNLVLIFEFKINSTPEIALAQIHEKGYAERYGEADKELILVGVNFDSGERKITSWIVE